MTWVFAHRGCTDGFVENTVGAFAEARRLGCDGVELDVRLSADGALVVHHDADIPGVGPVSGARIDQLPPYVPLLAEALAACEGMAVNVEMKAAPGDHDAGSGASEALAAATASTLVELGWAGRTVVSSFDATLVDAVRRAEPGLEVAWLLEWSGDVRAGLREATRRGYQGIHPFVSQVDAPLVAEAHEVGLAVRAWTVNSPDDLRAMVHWGADAVITDRVLEALDVVRGR